MDILIHAACCIGVEYVSFPKQVAMKYAQAALIVKVSPKFDDKWGKLVSNLLAWVLRVKSYFYQ